LSFPNQPIPNPICLPIGRGFCATIQEGPAHTGESELAFYRAISVDTPKGQFLVIQYLLDSGVVAQQSVEYFRNRYWEGDLSCLEVAPTRYLRKATRMALRALVPMLGRPNLVPCPHCTWHAYMETAKQAQKTVLDESTAAFQQDHPFCDTCECLGWARAVDLR